MERQPEPIELIGQSRAFTDALAHASAAAAIDRPLLICGERGSGKELIAGRVHFLSPRWEGPFIKVNCAALSDELLDSELFGHEAGAFTGATRRHSGRFERAEGGTLFLDEIASASGRIQEKLLRVIEYGEYERVGGAETRIADVRVVAAANADLPALAAQGKFRADLLDRLAFDVIAAPPLRERREDIPLLAAHFASRLARETRFKFDGFSPNALAALLAHSWPGNVRELKNAAERSLFRWNAASQAGPIDEIIIDPFPDLSGVEPEVETKREEISRPKPSAAPFNLRDEINKFERRAVRDALAASMGSQKDAAARLSLTYDQFRGLMKKHGVSGRKSA